VAFLSRRLSQVNNCLEKRIPLCCLVVSFAFLFTFFVPVQAGFKPDQIKAAYIYNLPNFVYWPDLKKLEIKTKGAFVIKVLGNKSIARYLEVLTKGEKIKGNPISIVYIDSVSQAQNCRVLFVDSAFENVLTRAQLVGLANNGILTVGESLNFLKKGGIVGLVPVGKRIVIVVNTSIAQKASMSFSSKLMKVAEVFKAAQGEKE